MNLPAKIVVGFERHAVEPEGASLVAMLDNDIVRKLDGPNNPPIQLSARMITMATWWGLGWVVSWLVAFVEPSSADFTFYAFGGLGSIVEVRRVVREIIFRRRYRVFKRAMEQLQSVLPETGTEPSNSWTAISRSCSTTVSTGSTRAS